MSLLFRRRPQRAAGLAAFTPPESSILAGYGSSTAAYRSSAVWAALRLRADLISTLPVDVYRKQGRRSVPVTKPPVLVQPASRELLTEWLYASQWDLDRCGNAFGQIVARDGFARPAQIELSSADEWTVRQSGGALEYRRQGKLVPTVDVWHERQYVVPGVPVGLSPVAQAAYTLQHNLSAQQFALQWFKAGAGTSGHLKNKAKVLDKNEAATAKERFMIATAGRGVFVSGNDWEFVPAAAAQSDARFLDAMKATSVDIARYFGVPADMIDATTDTGSSVTYANITERNLQLLTMHLGPAIARREAVFTKHLVGAGAFVKFNTDAMLRMDPGKKLANITAAIATRVMTPSEGRELLDYAAFTDADLAEFDRLFGAPRSDPARIEDK